MSEAATRRDPMQQPQPTATDFVLEGDRADLIQRSTR